MTWPDTDLDPIRRLHVLAAALPGARVEQTRLDAPFDFVWDLVSDLEAELPRIVRDVRSLTITRRTPAIPNDDPAPAGERLEAYARGYAGLRARFDIVLRPGWCVMRSRFLIGGMAAGPEGDQTIFAFLGGVRIPGQAVAAPLLSAIGGRLTPRVLRHVADRVENARRTGRS
jgi:hypothetical protein